MSDALIEAVARAIYGRAAARMGHPKPWSLLTSSQRIVWFSDARAALSAIDAAGCRVVPVEPTPPMIEAARMNDHDAPENCWSAMIAAAPKLTEWGE